MSEDVEYEADLEASPETVWRALEEPDLRDRWLAPQTAPGGPIDCEVIEADPPHRLRVAWRNDGEVDSQVEFTVTRREGGSRLRIVHHGLNVSDLKMAA